MSHRFEFRNASVFQAAIPHPSGRCVRFCIVDTLHVRYQNCLYRKYSVWGWVGIDKVVQYTELRSIVPVLYRETSSYQIFELWSVCCVCCNSCDAKLTCNMFGTTCDCDCFKLLSYYGRKLICVQFLTFRIFIVHVGNLNGVKPNERVVKCSWVKFKWEEVKCRQV